MKNIFKYTITAFATLLAAACQQELADPTVAEEEVTARFTVTAPAEIQAKADQTGTKIDRLHVEVYTDEECTELYNSAVIEGNRTSWDLEMSFIKGRTYHMILVAGCNGYFQPLTTGGTFSSGISLSYSGPDGSETLNANREEHDIFVAKTTFTAKTAGGAITLARPLAQINIYAEDFAQGDVEGLEIVDQSLTLKVADEYDVLTGEAGEGKAVTFLSKDEYDENGRVLMCYVLPSEGKQSLVDMDIVLNFKLNGADQTVTHNLTNVPVQTNYRTNISGNLYVENAEFTFSIGNFAGSSDVEVWDGVTTDPVEPDPETPDTYVITTAEQLAWFRDMVNGNDTQTRSAVPETFKGKTVKLGADIDLSGQEWEPIGYYPDGDGAMAPFKGVFDGAGHTISNFKISKKHKNSRGAALFGVAGSAIIKNLKISNANIIYPGSDDFYAAGVAGYGYSTTFENITVSDSFIEGNNKIGGIYGHTDNYESNPVIITNCHVSNCTLRSANEEDGGLVGGLVGVVQNEFHNKISKSSVKNCTIFGHNKNSEGKRSNGEFVANIIGNDKIILEITDCEISGNTFTQAENVTYVSPYGAFVGGNRNEGKGKVIVDGLEIIANGVGINAAGEYRIVSTDGLRSLRNMVNDGTLKTAGKVFVLDTDVDLNDEEWIPIGTGTNPTHFQGTFDGNGKTISNFKITRTNGGSQAALFGTVSGSPVFKNFTVDGAEVVYPGSDDYYAAGLIGTYYGHLTITGVTVRNSDISGNNKVAGLVAHDGSSSSLLIDDCHVTGCTISTLNQGDGGNVGGLIGLFAGGGTSANPKDGQHYIKNSSVKNCNINAINSTNTGKRSNGEFVACMTGKDNQILHIENCEISGNTFVDKQKDGSAVTYVSPYGPFVGGSRNDDGKGKVSVNGVQMIADGVALNTAGEYEISSANGMKWLAQTVNSGTGLSEKTVKLTADIDLKNELWTPIGISESNSFKGLFDGQNKTISNLKIESDSRSGLFGYVGRDSGSNDGNIYGSVRNLKVHNVDMKTSSGAAVVGNLFRGEISGIELTGLVKIEGSAQNVAGVVGYHYANVNDITVNVEEGSYVKSSEGYIGGVAGYSGEGSYTKKNITSNIDVIGCGEAVGGIIALLQYGNVIENAKCSADVTNTPPVNSHNRYIRTGGIAGCWVESNSGKTTVKNCEFTGTVKAERQDGLKPSILPHGGLVGFSYSSSGIASLDIDGKLYADAYKSAGLENAVKTAGVTVFLSAGPWGDGSTITPYTRPATIASNVTIEGVKEAKLELEATNWEIAGAGNLTVRGIHISWPAQTYSGFSHAEGIRFVDVTFDGAFFCWNQSTEFTGCTFNLNSNQYIWTYTCNVDFNDCTFNCVDGKGILVYHEGPTEVTVNLNKCTFSSDTKAQTWDAQPVSAIEIDNSAVGAVMNVNITECTSKGGFNYDSAIWRAKDAVFTNGHQSKLNITVDGVKQTL